jgi:hypothetical protein
MGVKVVSHKKINSAINELKVGDIRTTQPKKLSYLLMEVIIKYEYIGKSNSFGEEYRLFGQL